MCEHSITKYEEGDRHSARGTCKDEKGCTYHVPQWYSVSIYPGGNDAHEPWVENWDDAQQW